MPALNRNLRSRTAGGVCAALGLWLIASPWIFAYDGRYSVMNGVVVGALVSILGTIRLASPHEGPTANGIMLLLGFWIIVSPWVSGYAANKAALSNNMMVGVLVTALAIWGARATAV
jgi:hypothetical protein